MTLAPKMEDLATLVGRHASEDGSHATGLAPLSLHRASGPAGPFAGISEPALCIMAQGSKRVHLAEEAYVYAPGQFLLVSVGLPLVSQIIQATPHEPYLGVRIELDVAAIGELAIDAGPVTDAPGSPRRGLSVNTLDAPLLDAVTRLVDLLGTPRDLPVLAPLVLREITYRLLVGAEGPRLRRIAAGGGHSQRIARAIGWMRERFDRPLRVEDVARFARMSPSAFHHHFKLVTAMSPLQYQKRLRLQEARRLMLGDGLDAAAAAYRVGYESASQFSREYRRLFGSPPRRDLARLQAGPAALRG